MRSEALRLIALTPVSGFVALQWYIPTSDKPPPTSTPPPPPPPPIPPRDAFPCMTRRKKSCPLGSSIRWDSGFSLAVMTSSPLRYQEMRGGGSPSALQLIVAGSLRTTYWSSGCSTIRGLLFRTPELNNNKSEFKT